MKSKHLYAFYSGEYIDIILGQRALPWQLPAAAFWWGLQTSRDHAGAVVYPLAPVVTRFEVPAFVVERRDAQT